MRHTIILAPEAADDFKALKAVDRAAVRDAMEKHLRHEPTKTSKSRIKRLRGSAGHSTGCGSRTFGSSTT